MLHKWVRYNNDYYYVQGRSIFGDYLLINSHDEHIIMTPRKVKTLEEFIPEQYNKDDLVIYKQNESSDTYRCGKIINIDNFCPYRPYLIDTDNDLIWATPIQLYQYKI